MEEFKKVKFTTTFHNTLKGCKNYPEKILTVEILVPIEHCNHQVDTTIFIEENTNLFVLEYENYNWLNPEK